LDGLRFWIRYLSSVGYVGASNGSVDLLEQS
jgi:hypothetical protein